MYIRQELAGAKELKILQNSSWIYIMKSSQDTAELCCPMFEKNVNTGLLEWFPERPTKQVGVYAKLTALEDKNQNTQNHKKEIGNY